MAHKTNPRQLVLRRDTATGLTLVGWESDLPVGRFKHLELICELSGYKLPGADSVYYAAYQTALQHARMVNKNLLAQQVRRYESIGRYRVPFELSEDRRNMRADDVGNYAPASMRLQYELTRNIKQAWAVINNNTVVHVRARYPFKAMDELTYQVWYHKQIHELEILGGTLLQGLLIVSESGLWFEAEN